MKQPYNTALYMRLSRDDETYGDSVSIETQRMILKKYADENSFTNCTEYVDDGYSGTNFERPAFKRMMNDIDSVLRMVRERHQQKGQSRRLCEVSER